MGRPPRDQKDCGTGAANGDRVWRQYCDADIDQGADRLANAAIGRRAVRRVGSVNITPNSRYGSLRRGYIALLDVLLEFPVPKASPSLPKVLAIELEARYHSEIEVGGG